MYQRKYHKTRAYRKKSGICCRSKKVEDSGSKDKVRHSIHKPVWVKQVKGCNTSREVWNKHLTIYQSKGLVRKATLLKQLTLQWMEDDEDVRDYLRKFFDMVDNMEVNINPDLLTVMLLYNLPPSFKNFRCAIESRNKLPTSEILRVKITEEHEEKRHANCKSGRHDSEAFPETQESKRALHLRRNPSSLAVTVAERSSKVSNCRSHVDESQASSRIPKRKRQPMLTTWTSSHVYRQKIQVNITHFRQKRQSDPKCGAWIVGAHHTYATIQINSCTSQEQHLIN